MNPGKVFERILDTPKQQLPVVNMVLQQLWRKRYRGDAIFQHAIRQFFFL